MSCESSLNAQVAQLVDRLSQLPGRKELSVETRRYPRFLPAESGAGFEQKTWSFNGHDLPLKANLAIPADAEDVVVTWKGGIDAAQAARDLNGLIASAEPDDSFPASWNCEVFTRRRESGGPQVVVRVYRKFSAGEVS
jgi:hypothetical protein